MEIARRSRLHVTRGARVDLLFTMSDNTSALATNVGSARIKNSHERVFEVGGASARQKPSGGARRDRTDDLLLVKQALFQLSYGPFRVSGFGNQGSIIRKPATRASI